MIGFNTFNILNFFLLLILHIDYIYNFCFSKLWYLNLQNKERKIIQQKFQFSENQNNFFWVWFISFLLLSTKFSQQNYYSIAAFFNICIILIMFITLMYCISFFKQSQLNFKFLTLLFQIIIFIFFGLSHVDNFLSLFFFMELLAICYYFFFLITINNKIYSNLNQLKNLLILYLWNSFWTTLLFGVFLNFLLFKYGTLVFTEIQLLWQISDWYIIYFFFFAILLKLGLPFMHFIKLQIYNFLDWNLVFFYSIVTTLVNFCFLVLLSTNIFFQLFLQNISLLTIILLGIFFVLINWYKSTTLLNLLLFSAVTTSIVFVVILF